MGVTVRMTAPFGVPPSVEDSQRPRIGDLRAPCCGFSAVTRRPNADAPPTRADNGAAYPRRRCPMARPPKKVLAAIDDSLAALPVISTARAPARIFEARVEGVHVEAEGEPAPEHAAEAAGIPFRVLSGPVVDRLVEAGESEDVVALAIGARGTRDGRRPLGGTAAAVATRLRKPVAVVPPQAG